MMFLLFFFLLLVPLNVFCQKKIIVVDSTINGQIRFAEVLDNVPSDNFTDSKNFLKEVLNTGKNDDFYLYRTVKNDHGLIHEKFQQTFKGVKVEFGEFIVHKNESGYISSINGDFKRIPDEFNTSCNLNFEDVLSLLRKKTEYQVLEL